MEWGVKAIGKREHIEWAIRGIKFSPQEENNDLTKECGEEKGEQASLNTSEMEL